MIRALNKIKSSSIPLSPKISQYIQRNYVPISISYFDEICPANAPTYVAQSSAQPNYTK